MNIYKKAFGVISLGLLLSNTNLLAGEKSIKSIVSAAYAQISSMDRYAFTALVVDNDNAGDKTVTYKQHVSVKIERPGNLRVDTKGDIKDRSIYMHDGKFTMIDHDFGLYGQLETPKTIDGTLDFLFEKFGIRTPLSTLIYSDMHKRLKFKIKKYFGTVDVEGVPCDYVAFKNDTKEIHVWIAKGEYRLVKQFSIIHGDTRINTSLIWDINPKFLDSDFVFTAPKGTEKISINSAN